MIFSWYGPHGRLTQKLEHLGVQQAGTSHLHNIQLIWAEQFVLVFANRNMKVEILVLLFAHKKVKVEILLSTRLLVSESPVSISSEDEQLSFVVPLLFNIFVPLLCNIIAPLLCNIVVTLFRNIDVPLLCNIVVPLFCNIVVPLLCNLLLLLLNPPDKERWQMVSL